MNTSQPSKDGRILGLASTRAQLVKIRDWVPPSQAEVEAMPPVRIYPSRRRREALAAQHADSERGLRRRAEAERAARARQQEESRSAEKVAAEAEPGEERQEAGAPSSQPAAPGPPAEEATTAGEQQGPASAASSREPTPHDLSLASCQEIVRQRPQDAAKLLRTMLVEEDAAGPGQPAQKEAVDLPVMQQVAVLCVALGQETTGEVMKFLTDYEIEEITQAVASLKNVTVEMQDKVLEEFKQHLLAGEWVSQGGLDFARGALERAVGPRKAQEILDRVANTVSSGFYMLKNVAPEQVAPFISHEHPQTISLILSQLDPAQASGILAQLPERMQSDVAYRIATMENITPAILKEIEEALEQSLRDILGGNQDVGGPKVVADILNLTGSSVEKNVLDQMDAQDPEVAESVRNLMFTFSDISKLTDRELQVLLREVDQKDLVIALKGAEEELKDKILGNMSERVRTFISEEMEFQGPMRLSEVEEVQLRIVQQVRQLEEQGKINIVRGDADDAFV